MQIHLAPPGLEAVLREELGSRQLEQHGRLFFADDGPAVYFAQNSWLDVQRFEFQSISEAAKRLREIQRNWWLHSLNAHRRAQLIREALPPLKAKPVSFPSFAPKAPLGSWTLLDEKTMLYSARCTSPYPDGEVEFNENKMEPPSRAYLKLWEFFNLVGTHPEKGARTLDLGSSPGGWTWVLDQLGARVMSVDKAPLSEHTPFSDKVIYKSESAFALDPKSVGHVDWLFSDIICYPERLLELVKRWEPIAKNMVCTIKFQGPTDFKVIDEFLKISGSTVRHLFNNKHELTWSRLRA
ncbi:MAG: hypothetical protein KF799_02140 [Bdellovibrionales bacterium]|nr:hypothetical protein [Bdellovibrionales bacterium]